MLTKNILKYKTQKGKIIPVFIDPTNPNLMEFSLALCELFAAAKEKTRKEIEDESEELVAAFELDNIVAQGLKKLCFDLLTFESLLSTQTTEFRKNVFQCSFEILSKPCLSIEKYRDEVFKNFDENVESHLYSDLPEFHKVTEVKPITHTQLLNKYNVALVQGLLFHSGKLKIILPSVNNCKAQFRQLLKHIKFFQLVAYFTKKDDVVEIEIDGPHSLFVHTHKYGFNLACFFPALLFMPQWELVAEIEIGKELRKCGELNLSYKTKLLSHYKNYSAYIPEEFKLFATSFHDLTAKSRSPWHLNEDCDEILFDGDNYFFPDFEFIHENRERVYLELFHPWHSAALKHRLFSLAKKPPSFILILGVAKILLKDTAFAAEVQQYQYFNQFSFTFRDVVSVEKVLELLGNCV